MGTRLYPYLPLLPAGGQVLDYVHGGSSPHDAEFFLAHVIDDSGSLANNAAHAVRAVVRLTGRYIEYAILCENCSGEEAVDITGAVERALIMYSLVHKRIEEESVLRGVSVVANPVSRALELYPDDPAGTIDLRRAKNLYVGITGVELYADDGLRKLVYVDTVLESNTVDPWRYRAILWYMPGTPVYRLRLAKRTAEKLVHDGMRVELKGDPHEIQEAIERFLLLNL